MSEKTYTNDGFLIVSESDLCPLWKKVDQPCSCGSAKDCFFCKFSNFRTPEYQEQVAEAAQVGKLYSICLNEKNKIIIGSER